MKADTHNQKELTNLLRPLFLRSAKFQAWNKPRVIHYKRHSDGVRRDGSSVIEADPIAKHFAPVELAKAWGVSTEMIRSIFREEPGVLKLGKAGTKYRRGYFTLRIPREVAERVHRKLSA